MNQKMRDLFKKIEEISPQESLGERIIEGVRLEKRRSAIWRLAQSAVGLSLSIAFLFFAWSFFGQSFIQSEFWRLLSLIFSDAQIVLTYWKDFSFSLLESLPVMSIGAFLSSGFLIYFFSLETLNIFRAMEKQPRLNYRA